MNTDRQTFLLVWSTENSLAGCLIDAVKERLAPHLWVHQSWNHTDLQVISNHFKLNPERSSLQKMKADNKS